MSNLPYSEAWLAGPSSTQFYTRTYTPVSPVSTKAVIVFVHGFAEHIGRYTHFHPLLSARGIAVFAYDQRGFGLTAQDTKGNKSKSSAYGKTCWKDQLADIEWAVEHTRKSFEGKPVFLMGHSMGGGEVLGFATQGEKSSVLSSLSGVIATSPLIEQATPASRIAKWVGGKLSNVLPYKLIPAPVNVKDLSHDVEFNNAYLADPLIKPYGSLKGLSDMLSQGELLLNTCRQKEWPHDLPVLLIHGTEDKVTSHQASQSFHDKVQATSKKMVLFPGGYHELQNEPDGVKEKMLEEVVSFIDDHLASPTPAQEAQVDSALEPAAVTELAIDSAQAKM
jgi:acylglycerol lipase